MGPLQNVATAVVSIDPAWNVTKVTVSALTFATEKIGTKKSCSKRSKQTDYKGTGENLLDFLSNVMASTSQGKV